MSPDSPSRAASGAVDIVVDGARISCARGMTVAAAVHVARGPACRTTARRGEPRGAFCGMGVCFECVMVVDGRPGVRTCMTPVRDGMDVRSQSGWGAARP